MKCFVIYLFLVPLLAVTSSAMSTGGSNGAEGAIRDLIDVHKDVETEVKHQNFRYEQFNKLYPTDLLELRRLSDESIKLPAIEKYHEK